ncbi:MAG: hypothetical protein ACE5KJ_03550 [Candidatus Zixiibacteriota bacterium]
MKKKIILMTFCLILFLIFTASSYGGPDPKYRFRGDPWDRCLSPGVEENLNLDLVIVVVNPSFYFVYAFQSNHIYQGSQESTKQKLDFSKNHVQLKKNERKSQK